MTKRPIMYKHNDSEPHKMPQDDISVRELLTDGNVVTITWTNPDGTPDGVGVFSLGEEFAIGDHVGVIDKTGVITETAVRPHGTVYRVFFPSGNDAWLTEAEMRKA